mmetsp:Transcript_21781/g.67033  ORF Transcript_21781/g.67033 Transcript_21781/m.67033 type:complete len:369 (+) Transcript_21781:446-1552(+)
MGDGSEAIALRAQSRLLSGSDAIDSGSAVRPWPATIRCVRFFMRARPDGDRYVSRGPSFRARRLTVSHQKSAGSTTDAGSPAPAAGSSGRSASSSLPIVSSQMGLRSLTDWRHFSTSGHVGSGVPFSTSPRSGPAAAASSAADGGGGGAAPARSLAKRSRFFCLDRCVDVRPSSPTASSSDSVSGSRSHSSMTARALPVATSYGVLPPPSFRFNPASRRVLSTVNHASRSTSTHLTPFCALAAMWKHVSPESSSVCSRHSRSCESRRSYQRTSSPKLRSLPAAHAIMKVVRPSGSRVAGATPAFAMPHRTVWSFWLMMASNNCCFLSPPPPGRPIVELRRRSSPLRDARLPQDLSLVAKATLAVKIDA